MASPKPKPPPLSPPEDRLLFETEFPTAGTYRLYLQFDHGGAVRTGELTVHAEEAK